MKTFAVQDADSEAAKIPYRSFFGGPLRDTWLSIVVLCFMMVTMLALFLFPVRRIFANVEVNYNEGWNAYQAARVAHGIPLYRTLPGSFGTGTGYPPLSFHIVSWLGSTNSFTEVGRFVSLFSLLATGLFVGLIVGKAGGSQLIGIFSFLLYEIGIALLRADRVGMYDPQLLGEALSAAGFYCYIREPNSRRLLCLSAVLFCLAGFTKPNLIALPGAIAIDLLIRSSRGFIAWAAAMLLTTGLLSALTFMSDGPYLLNHLTGAARGYSYFLAWSQFHHYVEKFQALLVIATAWSIRTFRSRTVFVLAFVLSHGLAFLLSGGYGVDLNIFFNGFAATVIICGLALSDVSSALVELRPGALNAVAAMMFGLFFVSIMIFVPGQLRRDRKAMRDLPRLEKEFQSGVDFLKAHPGPALCESHLLCYEAGKPFEFEPFSVREQIRTRWISEDAVLQLLQTNHFQTVEVALRSDEEGLDDSELRTSLSNDQKDPEKERRFTPGFMNELMNDYRLSLRTSQMALFCPK